MAQLEELIEKLRETKPAEWSSIPDIPLYMDQVLLYMTRQIMNFDSEEKLTAAMVNNYIKAGLLPRAEEKKYTKEHIALLTAICVLKNVMTAKEIKPLLSRFDTEAGIKDFYSALRGSIEREMDAAVSALSCDMTTDELTSAALEFAVAAYSRQLVCAKIIDILSRS